MSTGSTTAESGAARFSRNVIGTLGARLLMAFGSLASGVIVARWLGAEAVGMLASLTVLAMVGMTLGTFGIPSTSTFLVARDRDRARAIVFHAVVFALTSGVVIAATIILVTFAGPQLFADIPPILIIVTACAVPFQMLTIFSQAAYLGFGNIARYNMLDLLTQAALVINPVVAVAVMGMGLLTLVSLNAISAFILSLIVLTILLRTAAKGRLNVEMQFDRALLSEMLGYGFRFYISMLGAIVILRADLLIVNYFRGAAEAGVYAVAAQFSTLLMLIPNVISTVLFPRAAEARDIGGDMTCRVSRHSSLIMLMVCVAAIPLVFLLPYLYGVAFAAVPYQVLILLPGIYFLGIETVQVQHFNSTGLPGAIPVFWIATMIVNIALNIALVPSFGAYAAAGVSSVTYALMFVLIAQLFRKRTGRTFRDAFVLTGDEFRSLINIGRTLKIRAAGTSR